MRLDYDAFHERQPLVGVPGNNSSSSQSMSTLKEVDAQEPESAHEEIFSKHPAPALLGSQNRQRAGQGSALVQVNMKADLPDIYGAPTRTAAEVAIDMFADNYGAKCDKRLPV